MTLLLLFNILLYFLFFLFWRKKNKNRNIGILTYPAMLLFTSVMCFSVVIHEPKEWHLTIIPFIYLFVSFCLLAIPLHILAPKSNETIMLKNRQLFNGLSFVFIVFSLFSGYLRGTEAFSAISSGEWLLVREEMYQMDEPIYNSFFERLALNASELLEDLGTVYLFYLISGYNKKKTSKLFIFALSIAVIFPPIIRALSLAARGSLFYLILKLWVVYAVFYKSYSKKVRKAVAVSGIVIGVIIVIFVAAITLSRFEDDSQSSLVYYFGHSMCTFNYGVMDSIHSYTGGTRFFGDYYKMLFGNSIVSAENNGTHCGTSFITVVGCLLVDFGPYLSLIVIGIIVLLFSRKHKKNVDLADVYLYLVYSEFLINGVFVFGAAYGIKLVIRLLIYYLVSFNFSNKRIVGTAVPSLQS